MTTAAVPRQLLRVDLSSETISSEKIPDRWLEHYLGGKGLGARYLYDELRPGIDPLGEENILCLFRGPFSGYLPGETRYCVITKSPLTGIFVDSYSGGTFARSFIGALEDYMGIVIEGTAAEPRSIHLEDGRATLDDASNMWGSDTSELDDIVTDGAVAGIGPAGEQQVRYATIASDGGDHHAGRGGTGAVMGSKRLKAIVAHGEVPADPELEQVRERYEDKFGDDHRGRWHQSSGTVETVDAANTAGVLPTRGWTAGQFDQADDIGIDAIKRAASDREHSDQNIQGDFDIDGTIPRGGLAIALGANLGIGDMDAIVDLGRHCDTLGLDIIETGNAIALAMLATEHGVIEHDIGFGDAEATTRLIAEIAARSTPLGDTLADGIDSAANELGGGDLVPTVKSMAVASYDPRPAPSMALAFATSDRGACHRRSRPIFDELFDETTWSDRQRVEAVIKEQDLRSLLWSYIVDDVTAPAFEDDLGIAYFEALDWEMTVEELRRIGERIWTLTRLFNVREGLTEGDDHLPDIFETPLETGPADGAAIDPDAFDRLKQLYYERRGWDGSGEPTPATLERLDLTELVDSELTRSDTSSR